MTDDISRILGQLETGITNLAKQQEVYRAEQRADNKLLFDGLNNIAANGCATGKRNAEAIEELKQRPEKLIGIGGALVSMLTLVGNLAIWFWVKVKV